MDIGEFFYSFWRSTLFLDSVILLVIEDLFSMCIKIVNALTLSSLSVLSDHKLSKALIYCWRNCQPNVSGCPTFHGPDDFPEHVVVCATPDISSFVFPLAGTACTYKCATFFFFLFFFLVTLTCHCVFYQLKVFYPIVKGSCTASLNVFIIVFH